MNVGPWFRDHPRWLERSYQLSLALLGMINPLLRRIGYQRLQPLFRAPERLSKKLVFDCSMCGQCVLHATGMTCPMTCPKNIRNGPCGGVRQNGNCEVYPEKKCIWVEAYERSTTMGPAAKQIHQLQRPLNHQLAGSSAWLNLLEGLDEQEEKEWNS